MRLHAPHPSLTRDLLSKLGHQPKRFLGQNFLVDGNIVRKSLELAEIRSGDRVVEVGTGGTGRPKAITLLTHAVRGALALLRCID